MITEQTLILAVAGFVMANFVRTRYRHEFIVTESFAGLLYQTSTHQLQCNRSPTSNHPEPQRLQITT